MSEATFIHPPSTDPTPVFETFRWRYASNILTAAVAHFDLFNLLAKGGLTQEELQQQLQLESRPFKVFTTALMAMGLIQCEADGTIHPTPIALEHLDSNQPFFVGDYLGLAANAPEVLDLVERLKTNRPADIDNKGAAFIYRAGVKSAMEQSELARHFTLSLAGRARNVAPALANNLELNGVNHLVDVAGGTGIYALALLEKNPALEITLVDLPEVLQIADEVAGNHPARKRLHLEARDMFEWTPPQEAEVILFSNIFHDWDIPECQQLVQKYSRNLPDQGRLVVHDVYLNDSLDGPLPIALYSTALFTLTEGRAYAAGEYRSWMEDCGLRVSNVIPTLVHCGILTGTRA